jgi:bloom syndrome protein
MSILDTLHKCFGYKQFRPQQEEIVEHILNGQDLLVLMPTGAGKSICYQLPALCEPGITVVISPLISLMFDQVKDLADRGIIAHRYDSTNTTPLSTIMSEIREGSCNLLYTTPESITSNTAMIMELEALHNEDMLKRFIIDEAHCVSNWGHDFRPAYLELHMKQWFPGVQICAFTATATTVVANDIINNLSLENPVTIRSSFIKSSINYSFRCKTNDKWAYLGGTLAKIIAEHKYTESTGIIYCLSRKECEFMAKVLSNKGVKAKYYHARIPTHEKDQIQTDWLSGKVKVIVATIAFALGINKPDVRYVIHTSMPKSIESYYQQTGRAGRDGKPCKCITFFSEKDKNTLLGMVSNVSSGGRDLAPPVRNTDRVYEMYKLCNNKNDCIKKQLSVYLGENLVRKNCSGKEVKCANCVRVQPTTDYTNLANLILSMIGDGCELSELKRARSFVENRIIMNLLNDGYLITEIIDGKEIVTVVMSPDPPYKL